MLPTMPDPQLALRKHLLPDRMRTDRGRRKGIVKSPGSGVRNLGSSSGSRHVTGVTQGPSVGLLFPIYKMGVGSDALEDERSRSQWVPRKLRFADEEPAFQYTVSPQAPRP